MNLSNNSGSSLKNNPRWTVITVSLGKRSYPIYIGSNLLQSVGSFFRKHNLPSTIVLITDRNAGRLYAGTVRKSLRCSGFKVHTIIVPPGERQKSVARCNTIYTTLLENRVGRRSAIAALGGGVIGDLAGFVAATYQRGVPFVQIPTTLLAQVDSSVGGKVGVNHLLGKNMIGAFYQPTFVVADVQSLRSLPRRELVCGLGEVIKYGVIMNGKFFIYAARNVHALLHGESSALHRVVVECCRMKASIVGKDELEDDLRAILNFGHTVGHALELAGGYSSLKHGEAVLLGIAAEAYIARLKGLLPAGDANRIEKVVRSIPLPSLKFSLAPSRILKAMRLDKKVRDDNIRCVLPTAIGKANLPQPIDDADIIQSVRYLEKFAGK